MFCLSVKSVLHPARIKGASFFQGWFPVFSTRSFGKGELPPAVLPGYREVALQHWLCYPGHEKKHRNAFNKHRVRLMRGLKLEKVQKVPVFYQNTALCVFSALIYIFWKLFFCVSPIPGPVAQAVSGDKRPTAK